MARKFQFGDDAGFSEFDPREDFAATPYGGKLPPHCIACEALLADAVDGVKGTLDAVDQAWFDSHIASCARCAEMLSDAQRGSAWLELLKTIRPEPAANLVERIIAQTSGAQTGRAETSHPISQSIRHALADRLPGIQPVALPSAPPAYGLFVVPSTAQSNLIPFYAGIGPKRSVGRSFSRIFFDPRLAMTAAMAFFSIALTLNLTGVRLNDLHASDLKPANLRRSYYQANTRAVQFYDNLRVVHVMESRVEDLKQATEDLQQKSGPGVPAEVPAQQPGGEPAGRPAPDASPEKKTAPPGGSSRREIPLNRPRLLDAALQLPSRVSGGSV